jgi:hypothetical protein
VVARESSRGELQPNCTIVGGASGDVVKSILRSVRESVSREGGQESRGLEDDA